MSEFGCNVQNFNERNKLTWNYLLCNTSESITWKQGGTSAREWIQDQAGVSLCRCNRNPERGRTNISNQTKSKDKYQHMFRISKSSYCLGSQLTQVEGCCQSPWALGARTLLWSLATVYLTARTRMSLLTLFLKSTISQLNTNVNLRKLKTSE